jgi:hypothetical protein
MGGHFEQCHYSLLTRMRRSLSMLSRTKTILLILMSAFLIAVLVSKNSFAQIYKWVDSNGITHYSEKKEHAPTSKIDQLNIKPQSKSADAATASAEYWQEQDRQFRQRQAENSVNRTNRPSQTTTKPESLSGGRSGDTAASKCNLARDVINGAVRHSNGAPIDRYDRETAENDVRAFCR